eukprot:5202805-Pleurochrysis_carterae.AAC.3
METTGENTNHNVPLSEQLKAVQTELMETKGQLAEARQEIVTLQAKLAQQDSVPRVDKVVSPQEETANSGLQDGESKATPASEREPGALLGSFSEVSFLAPRGKFDVCFHEAAITLKGKSSDVVVTYSRLQRLWELPDPATKGTLTVCQLSPPVENGKQSVSFLVLLSKPSDKQPMPKIRLTTDQPCSPAFYESVFASGRRPCLCANTDIAARACIVARASAHMGSSHRAYASLPPSSLCEICTRTYAAAHLHEMMLHSCLLDALCSTKEQPSYRVLFKLGNMLAFGCSSEWECEQCVTRT